MTDSPWDNGVQVAWDSTALGQFKTCPRLYYYSMVCGYRSRNESVHLTFGIHFHSALEAYDRALCEGSDHEECVRQATWVALEATHGWESDHVKNRSTLLRTIVNYLDHFRDHPATTLTLANGAPAVELSFRFSLDSNTMLCGHLDKVVEFAGDRYVVDRKSTASTVGPSYFDKYSPDNQFSLYTIAGQIVVKSPMKGIILDAVQIAVGFSRFERGFIYRTEHQLEEWLDDARFWIAQAQHLSMKGPRIGRGEEAFPMNDRSCSMFGGCAFRRICSKDARVRKSFLETEFEIKPWNPLEVR